MARLLLKFENQVLKELPLGNWPITIGRAPDNDIHIDNLAVSNYHTRIYTEADRLMVDDLDSLNGTFLNNRRIKREWLRSGDVLVVGKHLIVVDQEHDVDPTLAPARKVVAPKVDETVFVQSKPRADLVQQAHSTSEESASGDSRAKVPSLFVVKGRTNQKNYVLSSRLTIIGKSPMATVRLRGWFAPKVAAQISKHQNGYYLGLTHRAPKVNGQVVKPPTLLKEGDLIEIAGVVLKFMYAD